jgi:Leucine-rich repeat (LRR) protein
LNAFGLADGQALSGQIPTEFGLLTTVQHLNFVNNSLDGTIPSELCKLDNLVTLKLGWNELRGTVPKCLGQMESLQLLNLNFNNLEGSLPERAFRNVRQMYISSNNFTQSLPELVVNMNKLEGFSARQNNLYGNVESAFEQHAGSLVLLDLSSNKRLGGQFPQKLLTSAPHLEYLSLGDNVIGGRLPWNIPQNDKLKILSIYSNKMVGMIPHSIANLTALTHFIASDNQLTGPLPSKVPTDLTALFLSGNPFSPGPIPESWASLKQMAAFRMRRTRRNGNLPAWVGQNWTDLAVFDIGANNFEGSIPASWGKLPQLEYLFLNGNAQVSGGVPESFEPAPALKKVIVYQTNVTGNWEFICPNTKPEPAVLGTRIDKCSCCVLCDEWTCAKNFMDQTDKTIEWVYRDIWGI